MRDEMLEPLIGGRIARGQPRVHRLHRFPFAVVQEALDVPAGARLLRPAAETPGEAIEKLAEPCEEGTCGRHPTRPPPRSVENFITQYKPLLHRAALDGRGGAVR